MSTKFVSKNSNYMIVLKSGLEGNRALGTHAISGLYVKFQGGVVDVKEEAVIKMLRDHPSYGIDFLEVKESEVDPYADERVDIEPEHVIQKMTYGHSEGLTGTPRSTKLTPQMKKLIEGEAIKMLPGLLKSNPQILKDIITSMAAEMKAKEAPEKEQEPAEEVKKSSDKPKNK